MPNVSSFLDATAWRCPEQVAIRFRNRSYTYRQLHEMANGIAAGLQSLGVGRGSRVALCSDIRPGFIAAFFGILKTGAVHAGFDFIWPDQDFVEMIADCDIDVILCSADQHDTELAERLQCAAQKAGRTIPVWTIPMEPHSDKFAAGFPSIESWYGKNVSAVPFVSGAAEDVATIAFTSGTTGRRKAAQITHRNILDMTVLTMPLVDLAACDRRLVPGNYEGIMAQLFLLLLPVLLGNTIVLSESRDPDRVWRLIADERVTYILEMPLFYRDLMVNAGGADLDEIRKNLKLCLTGGAAFPQSWHDEFRSLVGASILPGYGATETTTCISFTLESEGYVSGKVGRPIPGVSVRIVSDEGSELPPGCEGAIHVASPGIMKGYLNNAAENARVIRDGWYRTGDYGFIDPDGRLAVLGRLDDKILTGYNRIDPTVIEECLLAHPDVSVAAAVGVPDQTLGNRIKLFFVLKSGRNVSPSEVRIWLAERLPDWMVPHEIEMRSSLPLTATGKIARATLRNV